MVRYGADSDSRNFAVLFGTYPEKCSVLGRLYGDAVASTSPLPFVGQGVRVVSPPRRQARPALSRRWQDRDFSTQDKVAKAASVNATHINPSNDGMKTDIIMGSVLTTSPTHPKALWCDDEPYQNQYLDSCHSPATRGRGSDSNSKSGNAVPMLLPAVYSMVGRHYIKGKPGRWRNREDAENIPLPTVVQTATAKTRGAVRKILAETQNLAGRARASVNSTAARFPPLPKHLTRGADQSPSYTTGASAANATFSIAVSSVTGAVFTGAVADTQRLPKMVPDGAHDRDDVFITCVF
jgi:hypothetical protein